MQIRDIFLLMKPRILVLLVITCLGGMLVATKGNGDLLSFELIFWTCLGLALSAGGANSVNMWFDADIDAVMTRTKNRPVPAGRLKRQHALYLGLFWGVVSHTLLWMMVGPWAALMALSGYLFYTLIYTMLLKRRTVQNIVIGGAAGAFPPVVGWAAVQGDVASFLPWAMFLVIFLWTPPHFWALALCKKSEYGKAGIPMLPVVKGVYETKVHIVYYMLILIPVTLTLALDSHLGWLYFVLALALGSHWLIQTVQLMYARDRDTATKAAKAFKTSLSYLALLFAAMVLDTYF